MTHNGVTSHEHEVTMMLRHSNMKYNGVTSRNLKYNGVTSRNMKYNGVMSQEHEVQW